MMMGDGPGTGHGDDGPLPALLSTGGDPDVDAWCRAQWYPLVDFLRRRGGESEIEDLAQESFARFLPYVRSRPVEAWRPMLYRIAINALYERHRRAGRRDLEIQIVPLHPMMMPVDLENLDEMAIAHQRTRQVREAILELPLQCRRVCLLKVVRGWDSAQVARHCGISVRMVEKHVAHALVILQSRFAHQAVVHSE